MLVNIKDAKLADIKITGYTGPQLHIYNVSSKGLDGAVTIEAPKVPAVIGDLAVKYQLK